MFFHPSKLIFVLLISQGWNKNYTTAKTHPTFLKEKVKIILSRSASHKSCSQLIFPQHLTPTALQERSTGARAGVTLITRELASISGDWEQLFPLLVLCWHQWIGGLWIVWDILEKIALQQCVQGKKIIFTNIFFLFNISLGDRQRGNVTGNCWERVGILYFRLEPTLKLANFLFVCL